MTTNIVAEEYSWAKAVFICPKCGRHAPCPSGSCGYLECIHCGEMFQTKDAKKL